MQGKGRILRLPEVRSIVGLSTSTIYAQMALGAFPKAVQLTETLKGKHPSVGWFEADVEQWLSSRPVSRRNPKPEELRAA